MRPLHYYYGVLGLAVLPPPGSATPVLPFRHRRPGSSVARRRQTTKLASDLTRTTDIAQLIGRSIGSRRELACWPMGRACLPRARAEPAGSEAPFAWQANP